MLAVCNRLEDARLRVIADDQRPDDVPHLDAGVHGGGSKQTCAITPDANLGTPWGSTPKDKTWQLTIAVSALIMLDELHPVTERNRAALGEVRLHVDAAKRGTFAEVAAATRAIEATILRHVG